MTFSLLIHLTSVGDLHGATMAVVDAWEGLSGQPLSFFSNKGPGVPMSEFLANQTFAFQKSQDELAFRFATSRKRNASKLELYFTNPARAFYGDLNYIAASLPDDWLMPGAEGIFEDEVCAFIERAAPLGSIVDASFDHEDILHSDPGLEIRRAFSSAYHYAPAHVSYVDATHLSALGGVQRFAKAGFTVRPVSERFFLLVLPFNFEHGPVMAGWRLFDALEDAGTFSRPGRASHDLSSFIGIEELGNYLETFEARFGRLFAIRYVDGLRPLQAD